MKKVITLILLCAIMCCMYGCSMQNYQDPTSSSTDNTDATDDTNEEVIYTTYSTYAKHYDEAEYKIDNGTLFGRGKNSLGLFGQNTSDVYEEWVQITDITDIIHVEAMGGTVMFLTETGCVYAMGNAEGLFPEGDKTIVGLPIISSPRLVAEDCVYASLGIRFLLLLKSDNTLWFLGESKNGQSTKVEDNIFTPTQIANDILLIKAFGYTTAWVDSTYSLYMCGDNSFGQIGNGHQGTGFPTLYRDIVSEPYLALQNCIKIAVSDNTYVYEPFILAETGDGTTYAWGGEYGNTPRKIN